MQTYTQILKFILKLPVLAILGAVSPHFKPIKVIFGIIIRVQTWDSLSRPNFVKIAEGIPLLANLYQKLPILAISVL